MSTSSFIIVTTLSHTSLGVLENFWDICGRVAAWSAWDKALKIIHWMLWTSATENFEDFNFNEEIFHYYSCHALFRDFFFIVNALANSKPSLQEIFHCQHAWKVTNEFYLFDFYADSFFVIKYMLIHLHTHLQYFSTRVIWAK